MKLFDQYTFYTTSQAPAINTKLGSKARKATTKQLDRKNEGN